MTHLEKIKAELTEIAERHKKDFEAEINGEKVFETIPEITALIDVYRLKLVKELSSVASSQLKYLDSGEKFILEQIIRDLELDFLKFASAFLLP